MNETVQATLGAPRAHMVVSEKTHWHEIDDVMKQSIGLRPQPSKRSLTWRGLATVGDQIPRQMPDGKVCSWHAAPRGLAQGACQPPRTMAHLFPAKQIISPIALSFWRTWASSTQCRPRPVQYQRREQRLAVPVKRGWEAG